MFHLLVLTIFVFCQVCRATQAQFKHEKTHLCHQEGSVSEQDETNPPNMGLSFGPLSLLHGRSHLAMCFMLCHIFHIVLEVTGGTWETMYLL